jgi:hypothetical protein
MLHPNSTCTARFPENRPDRDRLPTIPGDLQYERRVDARRPEGTPTEIEERSTTG